VKKKNHNNAPYICIVVMFIYILIVFLLIILNKHQGRVYAYFGLVRDMSIVIISMLRFCLFLVLSIVRRDHFEGVFSRTYVCHVDIGVKFGPMSNESLSQCLPAVNCTRYK
jgi:uncharacterized integral membrane protein